MDQESTNIAVSALTDSEESRLSSGRVFSGNETKPRCQISRSAELVTITDGREQRRGSERSDARNGHQPSGPIITGREHFHLTGDLVDPSVEPGQVVEKIRQHPSHGRCEGEIGTFYEVDANGRISVVKDVLTQPGNRYALLYGLADPDFPKDGPYPRQSDAGKLMALASFSRRSIATAEEHAFLEFLLDGPYRKLSDYPLLSKAPHFNLGVEDASFRDFAGIYSDAIFARFERFAREHLDPGRPLLIAGGCGLNRDWNSKWVDSCLFSQVFVPPVASDSGSAIGTAIDAQFRLTGNPKIEWDVYAGLPFRYDIPFQRNAYDVLKRDDVLVADLLANNLVLGWAHGRYEIGPRALGNRSILAAPFSDEMRERLNVIKQREQFRPIAPVCLREEAERWFGCRVDSPYMLYTFRATTDRLRAVTHVNGSARLQTVTERSNPELHALLSTFRTRTGCGVLCNTSLNFKGKGFINDIGDLDVYTRDHGLDGLVVSRDVV